MFRSKMAAPDPAIYERLQHEFNEVSAKYKSLKLTQVDTLSGKSIHIEGDFPLYITQYQYYIPIKISISRDYPRVAPEVRTVLPGGCCLQSTEITSPTGQIFLTGMHWQANHTLLQMLEWISEQSRKYLILPPAVAAGNLRILMEVVIHEPPSKLPELPSVTPLGKVASMETFPERSPLKSSRSRTQTVFDRLAPLKSSSSDQKPLIVRPKLKKIVVEVVPSENKESLIPEIKTMAEARLHSIENQIHEHKKVVAVNDMTTELVWAIVEAKDREQSQCNELEEHLKVAPWEEPEELKGSVEREASRRAFQETMKVLLNIYSPEQTPLSEYLSELRKQARAYFDWYVFPDLCEEYVYEE